MKKKFLLGLLLGTLFVLTYAVADNPWELQCDNGYCCTVHKETGEIGDCQKVVDPPPVL
jgi:hypothetical protein